MNKSNMSALKASGIIMIVFALVYVLLGTLAVAGIISNALPGHEKQETMIVILGHVVALLALVCGVVCIKGAVAPAARSSPFWALRRFCISRSPTTPSASLIVWQCALAFRSTPSHPRSKRKTDDLHRAQAEAPGKRLPPLFYVRAPAGKGK